jgi:dTDP-4-amino-4,6-dideoxygalactose transaminase
VIRVTGKGKRDALREKLGTEGIQTEVYYPRAMHEQDCFARKNSNYPVAQMLTSESLALPMAGINSSLLSGL